MGVLIKKLPTWVWRNWGLTEKLSASVHIQALAMGMTVLIKPYYIFKIFRFFMASQAGQTQD